MEAGKPTPTHSTGHRPTARLTVLHAERAGVLKVIPDVRTSRLRLEGIEEGSCCALHNPTHGLEVIGLDTVEIPTEPWGQEGRVRPPVGSRMEWAEAQSQRPLPQVRPLSSGASRTNTCMMGTSWISSCRPRLVWAMMKKVEGRKRVTLAVGRR